MIEKIGKFTSILQDVAVILSLLAGGYWAYKTFIFENPAFYETGFEVYGRESVGVTGAIQVHPLNEEERLYEVVLNLTNSSKTVDQLLNYDKVNVFYSELGSPDKEKLQYMSNVRKSEGFTISRNQSSSLKYLLKLPKEGTYVIETNLCEKWLRDCILQKFINSKG